MKIYYRNSNLIGRWLHLYVLNKVNTYNVFQVQQLFTYRESTKHSQRNTDCIDFDKILEHVGGWGIFQWKLTGILVLTTFVMSYVSFSPILYMYTPDHWCNIPQNYSDLLQISNQTNLEILEEIMIPIDKVTLKKSQCFMYDPNSIDDATTSANRSQWQTIKCMHGWQYNFTGYYASISTKVSFKLGFLQIGLGYNIHLDTYLTSWLWDNNFLQL